MTTLVGDDSASSFTTTTTTTIGYYTRTTAIASGTCTSLWGYFKANGCNVVMACYDHNITVPNNCLGYTSAVTLTSSDTWVEFPVVTPFDVVNGTTYWLAFMKSDTTTTMSYERAAGGSYYRFVNSSTYPTWESPANKGASSDFVITMYGSGTIPSVSNAVQFVLFGRD